MNVENQPLVEPSKILLPSMHFKLGLIKKLCKGLETKTSRLYFLREMFSRLSEAKLKEGIFIGTQIRELIKDEYFYTLLQGDEKAAWGNFKFVVKGFLGKRRIQNFEELVNNLL